ncbi:MAG: ribonuclease P protein component [Hyphomicrobiaceae bacterium]|nr:ribonuclease P protein component [Hyphomicrobiaceae bacterium]
MEPIRKRRDFLATRSGPRAARGAFVVQGRRREGTDDDRFGLTVTRKVGTAVERNRIKRRLRAALRQIVAVEKTGGFDYVIVARRDCLALPFGRLTGDLASALKDVATRRPQRRAGGPRKDGAGRNANREG